MANLRHTIIITAALTVAALLQSGMAQAQNAVGIGGRTSVTGNLSVVTSNPDVGDDSTTLTLQGIGAYTTEDARWEIGVGLTILGLFADEDFGIYVPAVEGRINSDALGPEENIILYAGVVMGVTIIDSDVIEDELFAGGPKFGGEFYVSPNSAIQIQDTVLIDTDQSVTNNFTVGFKYLFRGI